MRNSIDCRCKLTQGPIEPISDSAIEFKFFQNAGGLLEKRLSYAETQIWFSAAVHTLEVIYVDQNITKQKEYVDELHVIFGKSYFNTISMSYCVKGIFHILEKVCVFTFVSTIHFKKISKREMFMYLTSSHIYPRCKNGMTKISLQLNPYLVSIANGPLNYIELTHFHSHFLVNGW